MRDEPYGTAWRETARSILPDIGARSFVFLSDCRVITRSILIQVILTIPFNSLIGEVCS